MKTLDDDDTELDAAKASIEDNGLDETLESMIDTIHALNDRAYTLAAEVAKLTGALQNVRMLAARELVRRKDAVPEWSEVTNGFLSNILRFCEEAGVKAQITREEP